MNRETSAADCLAFCFGHARFEDPSPKQAANGYQKSPGGLTKEIGSGCRRAGGDLGGRKQTGLTSQKAEAIPITSREYTPRSD